MKKNAVSALAGSFMLAITAVNDVLAESSGPVDINTYTLSTKFIDNAADTINPNNIKENIVPEFVNLGGRGPHYLRIYQYGGLNDGKRCSIIIDAVNRKTGDAMTILNYGKQDVNINQQYYTGLIDGVRYKFKSLQCSPSGAQDNHLLEITQDLTEWPQYAHSKSVYSEMPANYASSINVRWDTNPTERLVSNQIIGLPSKLPQIITTTLTKNQQLAFENLSGTSFGGTAATGINIFGFKAEIGGLIQKNVSQSFEQQFGVSRGMEVSVQLDPQKCDKWQVKIYETAAIGYLSVPNDNKEYPLSIPLSQRIEPINLCTDLNYSGSTNSSYSPPPNFNNSNHSVTYTLSKFPVAAYNGSVRESFKPQYLDLYGRGKHYLRTYQGGYDNGSCAIIIDAIDRKTGAAVNFLDYRKKDMLIGNIYTVKYEGITYTFNIKSCETEVNLANATNNFTLEVTQNLSEYNPN